MTPVIRMVSRSPHPAESSLKDPEDRSLRGLSYTPGRRIHTSCCPLGSVELSPGAACSRGGVGGREGTKSRAASHTLGNGPKSH